MDDYPVEPEDMERARAERAAAAGVSASMFTSQPMEI